jgi:single-stranded-DNA-specific exonuclease
VEAANGYGMEVVVTDHHQLPPNLPPAAAIVNPHLGGGWEAYPLAGVGVAFMLAWGLSMAMKTQGIACPVSMVENLALVALGTIADLAPLVGTNRILVRHGLNFLAQLTWPGLAALRKKVVKSAGYITTQNVSFGMAPRLNAAGRLGQAEVALDILIANDPHKAEQLADQLEGFNRRRLSDQKILLEDALDQLADMELLSGGGRTIVSAGEGWPKGLLGLVATRVVEETQRPTILLSLEDDKASGSGRSVPGFNLFRALEPLRDLCLSMGGHAQAAGLRLKREMLPKFREAFERSAHNQEPPQAEPQLDVDMIMSLSDLAVMAPILAQLEPFGSSHPSPVVVLKNARILEAAPTKSGGDQHMMLRLFDGQNKIQVIGFGLSPRLHEIGASMDLALKLETDKFGRYEPNWRLLDFKQPM